MGERIINPKFNIHKIYKKVNIINPYKFDSDGGDNNEPSIPLIAEYPMTEQSGNMIDIVNGYNGIIYNSVNRDGSKYTFNGIDSYVKITDEDDFTANAPFEIEMDITLNNLDGSLQFIIAKRENQDEWNLALASNRLSFSMLSGSSDIGRRISASEITEGVEYNLRITYDGSLSRGGIAMFLNGVRKDTINSGGSSIEAAPNTDASVFVGTAGFADNFYFDGSMRNLKFKKQ